jgi:hypothetical protein
VLVVVAVDVAVAVSVAVVVAEKVGEAVADGVAVAVSVMLGVGETVAVSTGVFVKVGETVCVGVMVGGGTSVGVRRLHEDCARAIQRMTTRMANGFFIDFLLIPVFFRHYNTGGKENPQKTILYFIMHILYLLCFGFQPKIIICG